MCDLLRTVRSENCINVHISEDNVTGFIDKKTYETGKLVIAESVVCWQRADGVGLCLPYPAISLHAVSRDLKTFPHECLYLMIDPTKLADSVWSTNEEADKDILEIRFVPESGKILEELFDAMSKCQLLHPDPEDDLSDEYVDAEEGDNDIEKEDGGGDNTMDHMAQLSLQGSSISNGHQETEATVSTQGVVPRESGQFDDADDME